MNAPLDRLARILASRGGLRYGVECVTQRQHALQCAALARDAGAPAYLVAAALLHDVGHILGGEPLPEGLDDDLDDGHEERGARWIDAWFGPRVSAPVRLHVEAKRFLCGTDPSYAATLSPTSLRSLRDQGGPMDAAERERFLRRPGAADALRLRRWDDLAKDPAMRTPTFGAFRLAVLEPLLVPQDTAGDGTGARLDEGTTSP